MAEDYPGRNPGVKHIFVGKCSYQGIDLAASVQPLVIGKGSPRPLDGAPSLAGTPDAPLSVDPIVMGKTSAHQRNFGEQGQFESPAQGRPRVHWHGIVAGYSGYAKANREILSRISSEIDVVFTEGLSTERLDRARDDSMSERAVQITFLPPKREIGSAYRVVWTMMETESIHPEMIRLMNENYQECWTPSQWNAETFKKSGLRIPVHVMSLGVDPEVYRPEGERKIPEALRLTGPTAGEREVPQGFLFIYLCQPTFRKGIEVLLDAFDEAFHSDASAGLIVAATAYPSSDFIPQKDVRSRIWLLTGGLSELEVAALYRGTKAYVCTSRGEGLNLPVIEAAATGVPVIVPKTSVHPEIVPQGHGFFFESDGWRVFPEAEKVSPWFSGIPFPDYGPESRKQLVNVLRQVKANYANAAAIGTRYMRYVRSKYSWDAAARKVAERIRTLEGSGP